MIIAKRLGLSPEIFCRVVVTTKMLLSNVLGHVAELHYEKYLKTKGIKFKKAPTDEHYDYIVNGKREQVKRFETATTNNISIGVNLTQTHGDRSGQDAFYTDDSFDNLILFDVGFNNLRITDIKNIPKHPNYPDHLAPKFIVKREKSEVLSKFNLEFLETLKFKNSEFPKAIETLRNKYKWTYTKLLEKLCNLTINEIDSLFSEENFRLITGAKGFAAEEHFNVFLDKHEIPYKQDKNIYSKVDHWIKGNIRVQVKIPNQRSVDDEFWGFKTHKSHGHGLLELYKSDEFDIIALFIGFEIDESKSKYLPVSVKEEFIFIPVKDLEKYPGHPEYLKRVNRVKKDRYKINDITIFNSSTH